MKSTYERQLEREMCGTCVKRYTCDHFLRGRGILVCVDYEPREGTRSCLTCGKLVVVGMQTRCPFCNTLVLNPKGWKPVYAKITPEGRIIKIMKSRPAGGLNEPDMAFSKIILRRKAKEFGQG